MKKPAPATSIAPDREPPQGIERDAKFYEAKHAVVFKAADCRRLHCIGVKPLA